MVPGTPPLVYLDNSVLSRLTDIAPALADEIEMVRRIVAACQTGRLLLLNSVVIETEVANGPEHVQAVSASVLTFATGHVSLADLFRAAHGLGRLGMEPVDALHIAAAIVGHARYAVSCDDDWLRRATRIAALVGPVPKIVAPNELVLLEGL